MKINRRNFLKSLSQAAIGSSIAIVGGYEYGKHVGAKRPVVERVQVPLKGLKPALEAFKIVQLSDFHLYPYTQLDLVKKVVTLANDLKADLIVLTGDYILQTANSIFELAPVLASLNARYGVFTVLGNHDLWAHAETVRAGLQQVGLPILHNEGLSLDVGRDMLYLAGVDDGWAGQPDLNAALAKLPANTPAILLAHEPDLADVFTLDGRVSLQLSGHSHGGQIRLPGIGAPILPYLGQKYDQGLFKVNESWVYTNRGIGVIDAPIRINCPPEITEITLVEAL